MGVIVIRHRARHTHQRLNRIECVTKDDFNTLPLPIVWPLYFAFKATLGSSQSNSSQGCGYEVAFVFDSRFFAIWQLAAREAALVCVSHRKGCSVVPPPEVARACGFTRRSQPLAHDCQDEVAIAETHRGLSLQPHSQSVIGMRPKLKLEVGCWGVDRGS